MILSNKINKKADFFVYIFQEKVVLSGKSHYPYPPKTSKEKSAEPRPLEPHKTFRQVFFIFYLIF